MEKEINELIAIIQSHRDKAYRKINEELVGMYLEIGKYLSAKIKMEKWGSKTVENISRKIRKLYPNLKAFDKRGLYRMVQFYETYRHNVIVSTLLTQISWTNNTAVDVFLFVLKKLSASHLAQRKRPFILNMNYLIS